MDASTSADGPTRPDTLERDAGRMLATLEHLTRLTGVRLDPPLARAASLRALRPDSARAGSSRMEQLAAAASECSLRVEPVRMRLADAVWAARPDTPLVAMDPQGQWVVLAKRGPFRVRVASDDGSPGLHSISRDALATRLGLTDANQTLDIAVVHPERPVSAMDGHEGRIADGHGSDEPGVHPSHSAEHPAPHRRLMGLLKSEMPDIGSLIVFSAITGILYLAVPLTVDAVVNNIAFGGQQQVYVQALAILSGGLLAFLALLALVRAIQHYLAEVIQRRLFVRLAADLAYRIPRVTATATDRIHAPELMNRFFDVVTVQKSSSLLLLDGVNLVLSAVIGMIVLGFYHPFLLAFDLVLLALVCLVIFGFGRHAVSTSIDESAAKYAMAGWLEELAHFPSLFKNPGGARYALERVDVLARNYLDARRSHFRILIRQISGLLALQAIASSALLVVGGVLVLSGELTLGQLVASEIIVNTVVASVAKLGKHLEGWYDAVTAADKIGYLIDLETEREAGEVPTQRSGPASVEVSHVSFSHDGHHPVFTDLSFRVASGSRTALVAPVGGGASTLLDLLHAHRKPATGHVLMDQLDLRQWSLENLRLDAALAREHDIFTASISDNVRLARTDIGLDDVRNALQAVGLLEDILAMPGGLDAPVMLGGRPLNRLQRTRLVLARAIVGKPRLLLIDHLLDGLNPADLEPIATTVFAPTAPWTVLVATRDPAVIRHCSECVPFGSGHAGQSSANTPSDL